MFSKACEYAIRATIHIGVQSGLGKRVSLKDIAKAIDSPEAFTAKILQQLSRGSIIDSVKGPSGGFTITKENMKKRKLSEIVSVIDGDSVFTGCGLGLKQCNEKLPCPVHAQFKAIRDRLKHMLETTNVYDLTKGMTAGLTHLKR